MDIQKMLSDYKQLLEDTQILIRKNTDTRIRNQDTMDCFEMQDLERERRFLHAKRQNHINFIAKLESLLQTNVNL